MASASWSSRIRDSMEGRERERKGRVLERESGTGEDSRGDKEKVGF